MGHGFHVEVDFSGFPLLAEIDEQGGDEAQDGGFVGEHACDAGAAFDLLVDALQRIGGAQLALVGGGSANTDKPWGRFSSIQAESFGAVVA